MFVEIREAATPAAALKSHLNLLAEHIQETTVDENNLCLNETHLR